MARPKRSDIVGANRMVEMYEDDMEKALETEDAQKIAEAKRHLQEAKMRRNRVKKGGGYYSDTELYLCCFN